MNFEFIFWFFVDGLSFRYMTKALRLIFCEMQITFSLAHIELSFRLAYLNATLYIPHTPPSWTNTLRVMITADSKSKSPWTTQPEQVLESLVDVGIVLVNGSKLARLAYWNMISVLAILHRCSATWRQGKFEVLCAPYFCEFWASLFVGPACVQKIVVSLYSMSVRRRDVCGAAMS